ncbi:hypothetical protein [Paenibacillus foliorum]|uniref:hypothetical protein n=1 Tax=Paenibacillus foliorum TaxID=2654974 RepID=UPI001C12544F|nr:hypothetical protein [Paenibacillus foliorum]
MSELGDLTFEMDLFSTESFAEYFFSSFKAEIPDNIDGIFLHVKVDNNDQLYEL